MKPDPANEAVTVTIMMPEPSHSRIALGDCYELIVVDIHRTDVAIGGTDAESGFGDDVQRRGTCAWNQQLNTKP